VEGAITSQILRKEQMMDLGRRMGEVTRMEMMMRMRMATLDWDCLSDVVDRRNGRQCTKLSLILHWQIYQVPVGLYQDPKNESPAFPVTVRSLQSA
jgi:hypothetical protein